jgi:flagellar basal body-associated protein FliL
MDPRDASVYSDTWSTLTWVLILSTIIVFVFALMITFIVMVQRSIDHSTDTPKASTEGPQGATPVGASTEGAAVGASSPPHAA